MPALGENKISKDLQCLLDGADNWLDMEIETLVDLPCNFLKEMHVPVPC